MKSPSVRLRARITFEVEYEPNPEHYPDCETPEEMAALDARGINEDPFAYMEDPDGKLEVSVEVVSNES